jgi:hypothetical protein
VLTVVGRNDPNMFRHVRGVLDLRVKTEPMSDYVELRIRSNDMETLAPHLSQFAADNEWRLLEMRVERPTLEDMFVQITEEEESPEMAGVD